MHIWQDLHILLWSWTRPAVSGLKHQFMRRIIFMTFYHFRLDGGNNSGKITFFFASSFNSYNLCFWGRSCEWWVSKSVVPKITDIPYGRTTVCPFWAVFCLMWWRSVMWGALQRTEPSLFHFKFHNSSESLLQKFSDSTFIGCVQGGAGYGRGYRSMLDSFVEWAGGNHCTCMYFYLSVLFFYSNLFFFFYILGVLCHHCSEAEHIFPAFQIKNIFFLLCVKSAVWFSFSSSSDGKFLMWKYLCSFFL